MGRGGREEGEGGEGGKGRKGRGGGAIQFLASGRHRLSYATACVSSSLISALSCCEEGGIVGVTDLCVFCFPFLFCGMINRVETKVFQGLSSVV